MNHNGIIIVVESYAIWGFFRRMIPGLKKYGINVVILTNCLSVYFESNKYQVKAFIIKKSSINAEGFNLTMTSDYLSGKCSMKNLNKIFSATFNTLDAICQTDRFDSIFNFNGTTIIGKAVKDFAEKNNLKTLYFEIGNFPGRIFVDRKGTNAFSELYENPSILDNFYISDEEYEHWKSNFLQSKLDKHIVPQAVLNKRQVIHNVLRPIDIFYYSLVIGHSSNFIKYYVSQTINSFCKNKLEFTQELPNNYVFFPLQVSNDSQILLHSDLDNESALIEAYNIARKKSLDLVIKIHPAERNKIFINHIFDLKKKLGFYISDNNTFEIINKSKLIVTINSTVGIESLIMEKKIICLGRAFYSEFDQNKLKKYLLGYLIEIDSFSDDIISQSSIGEILIRLS